HRRFPAADGSDRRLLRNVRGPSRRQPRRAPQGENPTAAQAARRIQIEPGGLGPPAVAQLRPATALPDYSFQSRAEAFAFRRVRSPGTKNSRLARRNATSFWSSAFDLP